MKIRFVSIFPEIFESFLSTSLIQKAQDNKYLEFSFVNPRDFTHDKRQQVDDEIYGWGQGMLLKAQPIIDSIKSIITQTNMSNTAIIMLSPSQHVFDQERAVALARNYEDIIFLCGRYEGFDHRVELRCQKQFEKNFYKLSLGQFITLGGEAPAMVISEAIVRLIPWVIKEEDSRMDESYSPEKNMKNLEYPQYTRPLDVEWMTVPDTLLSWHHQEIKKWKDKQSLFLD